jgi:hypothetical protein
VPSNENDVNDENASSMLNIDSGGSIVVASGKVLNVTREEYSPDRMETASHESSTSQNTLPSSTAAAATTQTLTSKIIAIENGNSDVDQTPIMASKKFIHKKLVHHHHHASYQRQHPEQYSMMSANEISENKRQQFANDEEDVWRPW